MPHRTDTDYIAKYIIAISHSEYITKYIIAISH